MKASPSHKKTSFWQQMYQQCLARDSKNLMKTATNKHNMGNLTFLAAKKRANKSVFYILEYILNSFLKALCPALDCLFYGFLWGGGGAGSVPAPVRSLLEQF